MGKCAGSTVRNLALWRTRGYGSAGRSCPHLVECFFTLDTVALFTLALFALEDGRCLGGACEGVGLTAIPIDVCDGIVVAS